MRLPSVVVARPRLVADRPASELDPLRQAGAVERLADVVGGLRRDADAGLAHALDYLVDARVIRRLGEGAQHRDARRGHPQAYVSQSLLEVGGHGPADGRLSLTITAGRKAPPLRKLIGSRLYLGLVRGQPLSGSDGPSPQLVLRWGR